MADRPDAPRAVRVVSCTPTVAEVVWRPAVAHNDPVLEYSVYYNMTFFGVEPDPGPRGSAAPYRRVPAYPSGGETQLSSALCVFSISVRKTLPYRRVPSVGGNRLLVRVRLVPGSEYTFYVRARNALGYASTPLSPFDLLWICRTTCCTTNAQQIEAGGVWAAFYVRARNALGWSERSASSTPVCRTPPTIPFLNPIPVTAPYRSATRRQSAPRAVNPTSLSSRGRYATRLAAKTTTLLRVPRKICRPSDDILCGHPPRAMQH